MTRPFVAERTFNKDEVGRIVLRHNLPRRGHTNEKSTASGKQLLSNENGERCPDRTSDDSEFLTVSLESVEVGVITGPRFVVTGFAGARQLAYDVSIWIEDADIRNRSFREILLSPGILQQRFGRKDRRFVEFFCIEEWR
jgi:hypothetical protein